VTAQRPIQHARILLLSLERLMPTPYQRRSWLALLALLLEPALR
jgi:hypothetical protein